MAEGADAQEILSGFPRVGPVNTAKDPADADVPSGQVEVQFRQFAGQISDSGAGVLFAGTDLSREDG